MRFHRWPAVCVGIGLLPACNVPLQHFERADASGNAPVPDGGECAPPAQRCGGVCVNVANSSTDCGRCGHDCGGGSCVAGMCQPVLVAGAEAGLDQPAALAVNATAIFWTERTRVRSCPLPLGCRVQPRLIADSYSLLDAIAVTDDAVYFTGCRACDDHHDLRQCPVSGCPEPAPPVSWTINRYKEIVISKTYAYWRDSADFLLACAHADCTGTDVRWPSSFFGGDLAAITTDGDTVYVQAVGTELRTCGGARSCDSPAILTNSWGIANPFRVHGGMAYWLSDGPTTGEVRTCALVNCNGGTTFAVGERGSTEIEVDDTGIYWMNPSGTLRHCPLSGCPAGGAATLASGRAGPHALTLGEGFLYWIEGNTILKLARP